MPFLTREHGIFQCSRQQVTNNPGGVDWTRLRGKAECAREIPWREVPTLWLRPGAVRQWNACTRCQHHRGLRKMYGRRLRHVATDGDRWPRLRVHGLSFAESVPEPVTATRTGSRSALRAVSGGHGAHCTAGGAALCADMCLARPYHAEVTGLTSTATPRPAVLGQGRELSQCHTWESPADLLPFLGGCLRKALGLRNRAKVFAEAVSHADYLHRSALPDIQQILPVGVLPISCRLSCIPLRLAGCPGPSNFASQSLSPLCRTSPCRTQTLIAHAVVAHLVAAFAAPKIHS